MPVEGSVETARDSQIADNLTRAGAPFEMLPSQEGDRILRVWKNGPQTLTDIFQATKNFADRTFISAGERRVTYGEFREASVRVAGWLREQGVAQGDNVAIMLVNRPEWLAAFFGIALVGATSALLNPAASQAELAHALALAQPKAVIVSGDLVERLQSAGSTRTRAAILNVDQVEQMRSDDAGRASATMAGAASASGDSTRADWKPAEVQPGQPASILFTAGTTGLPKGVVLSHRACAYSIFHAAFRNTRAAAVGSIPQPGASSEQQVLLMVLPLFHTSGICNAVLPLMMRGGRIVFIQYWSPRSARQLLEKEGVHIFGSVPMIAEQMVGELEARGVPPALQQVICGGGPPSSTLAGRIATLGLTPGQNWGMTETAGALLGIIGKEFVEHPGSCGLPAPIHDVRIASSDGSAAPVGEVGELQVRGPQVMLCYIDDPAATNDAIIDGWLRTGDLARVDAGGHCFIVDRAKDMLICAGENVYCIEIEDAIASHPDVAEVAALGLPHDLMGEQPVAVVRPREGATLSDNDVRRHAAGRLQLFKTPTRILVADQPLPRNRLGKIQKDELRRWFDG